MMSLKRPKFEQKKVLVATHGKANVEKVTFTKKSFS